MADQKNVQSNQRKPQASSNRPSQQSQQGAPPGQQQAHSNHPQQQRQQGQGVERAQRSLADRERGEADRGAPDDLLPDRQPSGWTSRDV